MTFEQLIAFNIVLFFALISPGPALLLAIQTTLSTGRKAGFAVAIGLALTASFWTLMALLGLDIIFKLFPWAYTSIKIAGALYLMFIAWQMWVGAKKPVDRSIQPATRAFKQGFITNALNPKSVLFAAAVIVVVFPVQLNLVESLIVCFNHLLIEVVFYSALALGLSHDVVSKRYLSAKLYLDRAASLVLGALGLRLLISR